MAVHQTTACARRQLLITELARSAAGGASLAELTDLAVDGLVQETGVRAAVARHELLSAAQAPAESDNEGRPFVAMLTSVLALAQRLHTVRALVDVLPDIVMRFDPDLRLLYVNTIGEELLTLSSDQMHGLPVNALGLPDLQRAAYELALQLTLRTAHEQRLQLTVPNAIRDRVFETRLTPELDANREVVAIVAVWREVN